MIEGSEAEYPQGHVAYGTFGRNLKLPDGTDRFAEYNELLSKVKKVDWVTMQLMLRELYERNFEIHDHGDSRISSLELIKLHPKENNSEFSSLYRTIRQFIKLKVFQVTGQSLDAFLEQPRDICDVIVRTIIEDMARDAPTHDSLLNDLKR